MHWRRISSINRRIDEIDDCHSCFMAGPAEKNTIQCVISVNFGFVHLLLDRCKEL